MAPVGPLGTTLKINIFITISTVLSSRHPPGFSCSSFINYMQITVFIDIATPNGLLNLMIFLILLQIPNNRKNKENINSHLFICISSVLSSWAPPMHMIVPLKCSKESIENAPMKTHAIQTT